MEINKFNVYLADLKPRMGTEPGKIRPVVVIQTDLLNNIHPSTIICPITSQTQKKVSILRVHLSKKGVGLDKDSDILVDQIRSINNRRFRKRVGKLSTAQKKHLLEGLKILIFE